MSTKYALRIITTGHEGDTEGPFYRYVQADNLESARNEARKNYDPSFNNTLEGLFDAIRRTLPFAPFGILSLDVKKVGRNEIWTNVFDHTQSYFADYRKNAELDKENISL